MHYIAMKSASVIIFILASCHAIPQSNVPSLYGKSGLEQEGISNSKHTSPIASTQSRKIKPVTTMQTALRQLGRLFTPSSNVTVYQTMPFYERIIRITVSWTMLLAAKSLLLVSPLYFRKLIETGSQFSELYQSNAPTTLVTASAMGLMIGYGSSRLTAGIVQLVSELTLSRATTICAEGLPLEAFACALVTSSQRSDGPPSSDSTRVPLSAIAAASGGHDEGRSGFARRALDRGLRASNQFLYRAIFSLLPSLVEGFAVLVLIYIKTDAAVGATAALVAVTFVVTSATIMKARIPIMRRYLQQESAANGLAEDALSLAETVAAFGATEMEVRRYASALSKISKAALTVRHTFAALKMLQATILAFGASAISYVTWRQATQALSLRGTLTTSSIGSTSASIAGQLILVQALFAQLVAPLDHVGQHFRDCVTLAEDLRELEALKGCSNDEVQARLRPIPVEQSWSLTNHTSVSSSTKRPPRLEVRNVSFAYTLENDETSRPILKHVSFTIPSGGYAVGIVGPSGSGKSTLLRVLLGLEQLQTPDAVEPRASSGILLVDGRDMTGVYRIPCFSMVGQESDLFRGLNLVGNVRYGTSSADRMEAMPVPDSEDDRTADLASNERIQIAADNRALANAASDAQLALLLEQQGWGAAVGPRGRLLSGGERQRVCLARALYRQELTGGILLMDEVTASLDAQTENLVTRAIMGRVRQGATAILIAHRMSSVRSCDLILVMKNGTVVERGNHDQLMRKRGWYYEAVRLQGSDKGKTD